MRFILFLLLFISVTYGQINDKNFKEKINGGIVVTIFSAEWQDAEFDEKLIKGVKIVKYFISKVKKLQRL
jgi:hypothetical protein